MCIAGHSPDPPDRHAAPPAGSGGWPQSCHDRASHSTRHWRTRGGQVHYILIRNTEVLTVTDKDTLNKGYLCIEDAFIAPIYIVTIHFPPKEDDLSTMIHPVHAFRDWIEAAKWYNKALETSPDADDTSCQATSPDYIITARLAEMYRSGGHRLERDSNRSGELYTQAAEAAMSAMKGKLANKYYTLTEEAWAELEDQ